MSYWSQNMIGAIAAIACLAPTAASDIVVYSGSGTIEFADSGTGAFAVGQNFTFEITIDTDDASTDGNPSPNSGIFAFPNGYDFRLSVPEASFDEVIRGNSISVFNDAGNDSIDSVSFLGDSVTITLRDNDGGALSTDGIPTALPVISVFEEPTVSYFPSGQTQNFGGIITDVSVTPGDACQADLAPEGNPDGVLNFFDVSAFITLYTNGDLDADFSGDGILNFFDVSTFIVQFSAGCP